MLHWRHVPLPQQGRFACELVQHLSRLADRVRLLVDFAIRTTALVFVHDHEDLEHLALTFCHDASSKPAQVGPVAKEEQTGP